MAIRGVDTSGITNAFSSLIAAQTQQRILEEQRKIAAANKKRQDEADRKARDSAAKSDRFRTAGAVVGAVVGGFTPVGIAAGSAVGSTVGGLVAQQQGGERVSGQETVGAIATGASAVQGARQRRDRDDQVFSNYQSKKSELATQEQQTLQAENVRNDPNLQSRVKQQFIDENRRLDNIVYPQDQFKDGQLIEGAQTREFNQSPAFYQQQFNQTGSPKTRSFIGTEGQELSVTSFGQQPGLQQKVSRPETISPVIQALREQADREIAPQADSRVVSLEGAGVGEGQERPPVSVSASLGDFRNNKTRASLKQAGTQAKNIQDINIINNERAKIAKSTAQDFLTESFSKLKGLNENEQLTSLDQSAQDFQSFRLENKDSINPSEDVQLDEAQKQLRSAQTRIRGKQETRAQRAALKGESVAALNRQLRRSTLVGKGQRDIDHVSADLIVQEAADRNIKLSKATVDVVSDKREKRIRDDANLILKAETAGPEQLQVAMRRVGNARETTDDMKKASLKIVNDQRKTGTIAPTKPPITDAFDASRKARKSRDIVDGAEAVRLLEEAAPQGDTFEDKKERSLIEAEQLIVGSAGSKNKTLGKALEKEVKAAKNDEALDKVLKKKMYSPVKEKLERIKSVGVAVESAKTRKIKAELFLLTNGKLSGDKLEEKISLILARDVALSAKETEREKRRTEEEERKRLRGR